MVQRLNGGKFVAGDRTVSIAAWMAVLASAMVLGPFAGHAFAQQQIDACVNNKSDVARFAPKPKQAPGGGCKKVETEVDAERSRTGRSIGSRRCDGSRRTDGSDRTSGSGRRPGPAGRDGCGRTARSRRGNGRYGSAGSRRCDWSRRRSRWPNRRYGTTGSRRCDRRYGTQRFRRRNRRYRTAGTRRCDGPHRALGSERPHRTAGTRGRNGRYGTVGTCGI